MAEALRGVGGLKGIRKVKRAEYGKLISGMPDRFRELIRQKGWRVKW